MEKAILLELVKQHSDIEAIGMILSNYIDYGHTEKGGMISGGQFTKVAECLIKWRDGNVADASNPPFNMKIYQTNASLGYRQLAYIIELNQTQKGHDYLVIGGKNITADDYEIGTIIEDLEDIYLDETDYKIENSPLYGSFLFDFFLKNYCA